MPQSIGEIRVALTRDRREKERRWGKRDSRVFRYNRRSDDRRVEREASFDGIDEDMIVEITDLVSELDLLSLETRDRNQAELTCIRQRPDQ